jgi:hypothetical protein
MWGDLDWSRKPTLLTKPSPAFYPSSWDHPKTNCRFSLTEIGGAASRY